MTLPSTPTYSLEPLFACTLLNHVTIPQGALILQPLADPGLSRGLSDRGYKNVVSLSPFWAAPWNEKAEALDPLSKHFWRQFNNRSMQFDIVIANSILSPRWFRSIVIGALTELAVPTRVACLIPLAYLEPNVPNRRITDSITPDKIIFVHPKPKISAESNTRTKHILCWVVYGKEIKRGMTEIVYETAWRSPESLEEVSL